jgi:hypothetical protein
MHEIFMQQNSFSWLNIQQDQAKWNKEKIWLVVKAKQGWGEQIEKEGRLDESLIPRVESIKKILQNL